MFGLMKRETMQEIGMTEQQVSRFMEYIQPALIEGVKVAMEDNRKATHQIIRTQKDTNERISAIDAKIEGEYVSPQDITAIDFAIENRASEFLDKQGLQLTIENILDLPNMDIREQVVRRKKIERQRKNDLGRLKSKILVEVRKYLGMKGNAPKNHIKRKDVDRAIQFIKDLRYSEIA
ncbi:hypothetical protein [Macrococcus brunensis]|uniref:hypothetical protein n=1 Tax=Macrococcus brunensis TaxID=198483 RepID=UPI001EF0C99A|nr:hypothetical protein [Macrococcus brunensis]ULG73183.1 hypothetical protein MGG13_05515 [Macrococcus brunensis]